MPNLKRYDPASRPDVEWWHIVVMATVVFMLVTPIAVYPIPAHSVSGVYGPAVDK